MTTDKSSKASFNPILLGMVCGFYPFVFYFSNNFWAINSWEHLGYFLLVFIGIPIAVFSVVRLVFKAFKKARKYQAHILFILIVMTVATLLSQAMYLRLEKKMLLVVLVVATLLAWKLHSHYKKLLVLILLMSAIPTLNVMVKMGEYGMQKEWMSLEDPIINAKFKDKPNIYLIQPDGYVDPEMMAQNPYDFQNPFYGWLEDNNFKVYPGFRSNYPASLASNSSMFSMKQHQFGDVLFPSIDMPNARDVIAGNNSAIEILRKNGYANFFIVQDEYFQQNRPTLKYDYYNIDPGEIPYFSDDNSVKKIVFDDLKMAMDTVSIAEPRFYFVEKLLPHHIHFAASKEKERNTYIEKIKEVNQWLKTTIDYISEKDPQAVIVILADHGGWVGLGSYPEMFSTTDSTHLNSIFSSLAAIKWNGHLKPGMDNELRSNVNLFRVLFAVLSDNRGYLENMEDNASYNLKIGSFFKSVQAVIDDQGKTIAK